MPRASADTACEVDSKILLFSALVLAMADGTAVGARLVLVVAKGAVQSGEFAKLLALEFILPFGDGGGLRDEEQVKRN